MDILLYSASFAWKNEERCERYLNRIFSSVI